MTDKNCLTVSARWFLGLVMMKTIALMKLEDCGCQTVNVVMILLHRFGGGFIGGEGGCVLEKRNLTEIKSENLFSLTIITIVNNVTICRVSSHLYLNASEMMRKNEREEEKKEEGEEEEGEEEEVGRRRRGVGGERRRIGKRREGGRRDQNGINNHNDITPFTIIIIIIILFK